MDQLGTIYKARNARGDRTRFAKFLLRPEEYHALSWFARIIAEQSYMLPDDSDEAIYAPVIGRCVLTSERAKSGRRHVAMEIVNMEPLGKMMQAFRPEQNPVDALRMPGIDPVSLADTASQIQKLGDAFLIEVGKLQVQDPDAFTLG